MSIERKSLFWAKFGGILGLLGLVLGVAAWQLPGFDPFGWQEPDLEVMPPQPLPTRGPMPADSNAQPPNHVPLAKGLPTVVSLKNWGNSEALIQKVTFRYLQRKATPIREKLAGKGPTVPVTFLSAHHDESRKEFRLTLRQPAGAPSKEWTSLEVAIVEPAWAGNNTYVGTLTVFYEGGKTETIPNVELDVLSKLPPAE